jgi:photoactive yellow protein
MVIRLFLCRARRTGARGRSDMAATTAPDFAHPDLMRQLAAMDDASLDRLGFGVIGFGKEHEAAVRRYNAFDQRGSGLERDRVVGLPLFSIVAQCMNNYLVAQRFDDAVAAGESLDATLDFTFTLRMKPTPVVLRLLSSPAHDTQFIAIRRDR